MEISGHLKHPDESDFSTPFDEAAALVAVSSIHSA
jgi:hypothetical protein